MTSRRRSLLLDDALWLQCGVEAAKESERSGKYVSTSEWVRQAMVEKLARAAEETSQTPSEKESAQ